jgi:hypothetical protein
MMNNLRSQINQKFDQKASHFNKFGSGGFSFGLKQNGGSGTASVSSSADTSSDTLDDFGSDLEPGVSVSDGSE